MLSFSICLGVGLLIGFAVGILFGRKRYRKLPVSEPEPVVVKEGGLDDILRLANVNIMSDLSALVAEHKVVEHMPGFFENFQDLIKQGQENYYTELWHILNCYRGERIKKLQDCGLKLTHQDLILLLLCEFRKDNRTIAHLMGINLETLKKRKTRLKSKFSMGGLHFETFMEGDASQSVPLAGG